MQIVDEIILLAQKIVVTLLKREKINKNDIKAYFDDEETVDIVSQLKYKEGKKGRNELYEVINSSKKKDWNALKEIIQPEPNYLKIKNIAKMAAAVTVLLGLSFYFVSDTIFGTKNETYVVGKNDITLKLDNGSIEILSSDGSKKIINEKGEIIGNHIGSELNFNSLSSEKVSENLTYNELTVPNGKKMKLVLSDGSIVHLNSGSSIRFPTYFINGKNRSVVLEGEAFFDVAKDKKHPFVVNANKLNIRVLGTKFNVSAFSEDQLVSTVLVEGSVSLSRKNVLNQVDSPVLLSPGNKATWNKSQKNIEIEKVDTTIYTAWMDGDIVFEHLPFKSIVKKLERHFNVTIINTNKKLDDEIFTATFDEESIEQIMNTFCKSYPMKYIINKNKIIIK
jgi:hypothetical protein